MSSVPSAPRRQSRSESSSNWLERGLMYLGGVCVCARVCGMCGHCAHMRLFSLAPAQGKDSMTVQGRAELGQGRAWPGFHKGGDLINTQKLWWTVLVYSLERSLSIMVFLYTTDFPISQATLDTASPRRRIMNCDPVRHYRSIIFFLSCSFFAAYMSCIRFMDSVSSINSSSVVSLSVP